VNFDQNFPADGVVDFKHAVRGSEDDFDVRHARFEHVVLRLLLLLGKSLIYILTTTPERERIVFKSALDDENARKFAAGGVLPFLLSNALSLCSPAGKRETDTEREFMKLCVNILISHFATLWEKKENKKQEKKLLIEWKSCHTLRALAPHALAFKRTHTHIPRARASVRFYISFLLSLSLFLSRVWGRLYSQEGRHNTKKKENK
jgi:hypothetical protein